MNIRSYCIVTASYWGYTLTDGALRMLVLFHFHLMGYSPVTLAFLFMFYELCGVLTNLFGGWIASRVGLKLTLYSGLSLQIASLVMLSFLNSEWSNLVAISYVMASQALSGIAKDLTKMSSKSTIKLLVSEGQGALFKWVAILTGSKNALKGVGFLIGGLMLTWLGFYEALYFMASMLGVILILAFTLLKQNVGKSKQKVKFTQLFSKSHEINWLSTARFFLFASRDVWFVVALPVFLKSQLLWSFNQVGSFMAAWVIGYGIVQAKAPKLVKLKQTNNSTIIWASLLTISAGLLALVIQLNFYPVISIFTGLTVFGIAFAINSSLHSYLILSFTNSDKVALDVGFYYMANACGRLIGTLLSGLMFLIGGLSACLWTSTTLLLLATLSSIPLKNKVQTSSSTTPLQEPA